MLRPLSLYCGDQKMNQQRHVGGDALSLGLLKKAAVLTRPTPARHDAPFRRQGRSQMFSEGCPGWFQLRACTEHIVYRQSNWIDRCAGCASTGIIPDTPIPFSAASQ